MADPKAELNPVTVGFIDTGSTVSQRVPVTAANPLPVTMAASGPDVDVNIAAIAGAAPSSTNALPTAVYPVTSGGLSISYANMANSNNATVVKNTPGQLYFVRVFNNSTTVAYLKFYNLTTTPTPGSSTVVDKFMIPASSGVIHTFNLGIPYSTGIAYACVTGFGDTDNTSVAASAYSVTVGYK